MPPFDDRLRTLRPLAPDARERLRGIAAAEDIRHTWASNALEGNTLTLRETQRVIEDGATIAGKPLREHLEAVNHAAAVARMHEIVHAGAPLNVHSMLQFHALLMVRLDDAWAGRIRNADVGISGTAYRPPNARDASAGADRAFALYAEAREREHPALVAADLHYRIARLHPFFDGNGRTARLLMNAHLLQRDFPPLIIEPDRRGEYLDALDRGQETGDATAFRRFVIDGVERALDDYAQRLNIDRLPETDREGDT